MPGPSPPKAPALASEVSAKSRTPDPPAKALEYEVGWSEEHMCAWRKEVKGPKLRGAVEYSLKPSFDSTIDENTTIQCQFQDGSKVDIPHITMVA